MDTNKRDARIPTRNDGHSSDIPLPSRYGIPGTEVTEEFKVTRWLRSYAGKKPMGFIRMFGALVCLMRGISGPSEPNVPTRCLNDGYR